MSEFSELIGCVITEITGCEKGSQLVRFTLADGRVCRLHHVQDCCESVDVEDVVGDVSDLIGEPVISAAELGDDNHKGLSESDDSFTWTFYDIATKKGAVTIRWYGTSNGYYSESVDFEWEVPQ